MHVGSFGIPAAGTPSKLLTIPQIIAYHIGRGNVKKADARRAAPGRLNHEAHREHEEHPVTLSGRVAPTRPDL